MSEPEKYPVTMRRGDETRVASNPTEYHQFRHQAFKVVTAKAAKAAEKS